MAIGADHVRDGNYVHTSVRVSIVRRQHLFLPFALRKLREAFGLTVAKSWYPRYFNTRAYIDYVGKIPNISYYGVDEMSASERSDFVAWYEGQNKVEVFDNRRV